MRPALFAAVLAMLAGPSSWADEVPPPIDVTAMCEMELAAHLPDPRVASCLSHEDRALRYLRIVYSAVPASVRNRCERLSRDDTRGFGSYAFIKSCVDLK